MKKSIKISLFILTVFLVLFCSLPCCNAESSIVECPDISVYIEGEITFFNDVTIAVNGRTLLPLRELLSSLGVQNDNEHIIWNNSEKSVTVYHNSTKIYLKQGDTVAYINDIPITLDAAPIGYDKNGRTYIPVRFVAQALGKEVVWDGDCRNIYIREKNEYNQVKDVLDKMVASMSLVESCEIDYINEYGVNIADEYILEGCITENDKCDFKNKKLYVAQTHDKNGNETSYEIYVINSFFSIRNNKNPLWQMKNLSDADVESSMLSFKLQQSIINVRDSLYAGLVMDNSKSDEIILTGEVLPLTYKQLFNNNEQIIVSDCYFKLVLDKTNYFIKSLFFRVHGYAKKEDKEYFWFSVSYDFKNINADIQINIPNDLNDILNH